MRFVIRKAFAEAGEPSRVAPGDPGRRGAPLATNKLRERAALGMGELQAQQLYVERMMRTREETDELPRRVDVVEDVTRGLGLRDGDAERVQRAVAEANPTFDPRAGTQRIFLARGQLVELLRSMKGVDSDARMEVERRAMAYWRLHHETETVRAPRSRVPVQKAVLPFARPVELEFRVERLVKGPYLPGGDQRLELAAEAGGERREPPRYVAVTGNTYLVRHALRALGGRWDGTSRTWQVPFDRAGDARELVEGTVRRGTAGGVPDPADELVSQDEPRIPDGAVSESRFDRERPGRVVGLVRETADGLMRVAAASRPQQVADDGGGWRWTEYLLPAMAHDIPLEKALKKRRKWVAIREPQVFIPSAEFRKAEPPRGGGWQAIQGGKHGGYHRRAGGKWEYWYPGEQPAKETGKHLITGDTYPVKEKLKALGAKWDGDKKGWWVPGAKADEALEIINKQEGRGGSGTAPSKRTAISGNTFEVRDKLRAMGGIWDGARKAWMVPEERAEEAQKLVAAAGRKMQAEAEKPQREPEKPKPKPAREIPEGAQADTRVSRDRPPDTVGTVRRTKAGIMRVAAMDRPEFIREDGDDMGLPWDRGWIWDEYLVPATEEEAAPLIAREAEAAKRKAGSARVRELVQEIRQGANYSPDGPKTKLEILYTHLGMAGSSGFMLPEDESAIWYYASSYDDEERYWKTPWNGEQAAELRALATLDGTVKKLPDPLAKSLVISKALASSVPTFAPVAGATNPAMRNPEMPDFHSLYLDPDAQDRQDEEADKSRRRRLSMWRNLDQAGLHGSPDRPVLRYVMEKPMRYYLTEAELRQHKKRVLAGTGLGYEAAGGRSE